MLHSQSEEVKAKIAASNREIDLDDGILPDQIVYDPFRRYSVKAILKYHEALALLAFIKEHDASPTNPDLGSAFSKVLEGLKVMGFEHPYDPNMHPERLTS